MKKNKIRSSSFISSIIGLVTFLILMISSHAMSEVSGFSEENAAYGTVQSVDFSAHMLMITGVKVHVSERTELLDKEGDKIALRDIRSERTASNPDRVRYWIREKARGEVPEVMRLEVLAPRSR